MSGRIITELELIQRYARDREDENWRFRSFLKQLDMDDAGLDAVVGETTDEVWQQIDCRACAHCCRTMEIVVDELDIERLARRLKMQPALFRRKYVRKSRDGGEPCLASPPCPFLRGNDCSVYEDRPKACRDFPYLHEPGFRTRTMTMVENTALCPIVFNTWERLKQRFWTRRAAHTRGRR